MELIKIPRVCLVDASGKSIGVYTADPDWWQQLKMKQQHHAEAIKIAIDEENNTKNVIMLDNLNTLGRHEERQKCILPIRSLFDLSVVISKHENSNESAPKESLDSNESLQCDVIGETPMHIAIVYNDLATIKFLVEQRGYSVDQRSVVGKFQSGFKNKITAKSIKNSKYEGLAYYGEYPLALAACFRTKEIYDYLLSKGADPNLPDTNGNTVLHVLVINNELVIVVRPRVFSHI
jgi:ankyrin repeat protein